MVQIHASLAGLPIAARPPIENAMPRRPANADPSPCPFLDDDDADCGRHFTLDQIGHAYQLCFNHYAACPLYYRLLKKRGRPHVVVTLHHGEQPDGLGVRKAAS